MKLNQVAIQLFTLRNFCKTPEDLDATLKKVAEIGYPAVQVSGVGPMPEATIVELLKKYNLVLCATHEDSGMILDEPEKVVDKLKKLGCRYTAYPYPKGIDFGSQESVGELIRKLERSGKVLHDAGMVLTYHNHHHEFRKLDGKIILQKIFQETSPEHLQAEIDTYWVQYGGGNPVEWCASLKNRLPLLHLKDFRVNENSEIKFSEIGRGNLNFKAIIDAADASGCEWFIVEQDSCEGDPFDSIRQSFDYIRANLVS